jgi:hypothetical protein
MAGKCQSSGIFPPFIAPRQRALRRVKTIINGGNGAFR